MNKVFKSSIALMLLVFMSFQMACNSGPLKRLQDLIPYAPAAIDWAVSKGRISPELGVKLKDDFVSVQESVTRAKTRLAAGESKAIVYGDLANEWRLIVARNHFAAANDPTVAAIAEAITTIINLIIRRELPTRGAGAAGDVNKQLDQNIDKLEKLLKDRS